MANVVENEAELLAIENDLLEIEMERRRKPYTYYQRTDAFVKYSEEEFRRRFRMSKQSVRFIYDLIGIELEPLVHRTITISGMDKLLLTLRYYATGSFIHVVSDFYGVSESSVCSIIPIVSRKIAALRNEFIRMPSTPEEINTAKQEFFTIAKMPMVIGIMDGTLIKIQEVGGVQNKQDLFCRKQFYALNVQGICNAREMFIDIVARWPGSVHDEIIFINSSVFERFIGGEFVVNGIPSILLGDGGYGAEEFVATPTPLRRNVALTPPLHLYQKRLISTRVIIERVFGQWKKRFACLWFGMRFRKLNTVMNVVVATAVLHNICKIKGEKEIELTEEQHAQYEIAIRIERQVHERIQNRRQRIRNNNIRNETLRRYFDQLVA